MIKIGKLYTRDGDTTKTVYEITELDQVYDFVRLVSIVNNRHSWWIDSLQLFREFTELNSLPDKKNACECGAHAVTFYDKHHSTWCPMWIDNGN